MIANNNEVNASWNPNIFIEQKGIRCTFWPIEIQDSTGTNTSISAFR